MVNLQRSFMRDFVSPSSNLKCAGTSGSLSLGLLTPGPIITLEESRRFSL